MFKTPEFFADIATKLESMGLSHIGNYIAGSDKFKYHVPFHEKARATMMAFQLPGKAGVIIATLNETIATDRTEAYEFYWSFKITYMHVVGHDATFLVEETASDPYAWSETTWQEWNFPYPEKWHRGFSVTSADECTYTTENARYPKEDDPITLYAKMLERHWPTVVMDGRFPRIMPQLWSPSYCFDCEEDFKSFLTNEKLKEVGVQIDVMSFNTSRRGDYTPLSDYAGAA